jgi:hypothetical protein
MKPSTKKFSQKQYVLDDDAKIQLVNWLNNNGYMAWINPDKFGIDVLAKKNNENYAFEVEVKHNWKQPEFQYKEVHFAARKFKFLKAADNVMFVMFNHQRNKMLFVDAKHFTKIVSKNTKYTSNETFYEIPIENCDIVDFA